MKKFSLVVALAALSIASLFAGSASAQYGGVAVAPAVNAFGIYGGGVVNTNVFVNRFGQTVAVDPFGRQVVVAGAPIVAVRRFGVFGVRRAVFVNRFVPGVGVVRVRVR